MDLGSIILRKICQRKKNTICSQLHVESKENRKKKKKKQRKQAYRFREETVGCQKWIIQKG